VVGTVCAHRVVATRDRSASPRRSRRACRSRRRARANSRYASAGVAKALLASTSAVRAAVVVSRLARHQPESAVVDAAQAVQEEEQEDRAGQDVEDAVPDHLAADADDVGAFGAGPCDRVDEPDSGEEGGAAHVGRAHGGAGVEGRGTGMGEEQPTVEEECKSWL
jgi:hypothetical protein